MDDGRGNLKSYISISSNVSRKNEGGNENRRIQRKRTRGKKKESEAEGNEISPFYRFYSPTLEKNLVDSFPVARFRTIAPRSNLAKVGTFCFRFRKLEKNWGESSRCVSSCGVIFYRSIGNSRQKIYFRTRFLSPFLVSNERGEVVRIALSNA